MSLFGSLMGDFDEDAIFGQHMRQMRQMNNFMGMGSLMPDPFNMLTPFDNGFASQRNSLFGFPGMPNLNRLLNVPDIGSNCASYSSSSVISMSSGPDGRPQVYQATSSMKTGPGGVRETRKTVQDSRSGVKKMAIGHHIGDRAHIIAREQNMSGQQEEHQEYINLEEDDADDFNREFTTRSRGNRHHIEAIGTEPYSTPSGSHHSRNLPAIAAPPSADMNTTTNSSSTSGTATSYLPINSSRRSRNTKKVSTRRPLRTPTSSPLALTPPSTSLHSHPYNASAARRNYRAKHSKHHSANDTIEKQ